MNSVQKYIKLNEKANDMLDEIMKIIGKQKLCLRYIEIISKIRDVLLVVSGIYLGVYLLLCCIFNFVATQGYNIVLISVAIGVLVSTIILGYSINKCKKLESEYDKLWEVYNQFKKDNNLN